MDKSVGAVIYILEKEEEPKFLLLHYPGTKRDYWGLAKGHTEGKEEELQTLEREIEEETGIKNLEVQPNFRKEIRYLFYRQEKKIFKKVVFYLAKIQEQEIQISNEHIGYQWLSFKDAFQRLSYYGPKKILKKAYKYLMK
jgi:bis(5'-nucleosidyl)-tetraphosphatase